MILEYFEARSQGIVKLVKSVNIVKSFKIVKPGDSV